MTQAERKIWREGWYKPKYRFGGRDATSRKVDLEGGRDDTSREEDLEGGMTQAER